MRYEADSRVFKTTLTIYLPQLEMGPSLQVNLLHRQ